MTGAAIYVAPVLACARKMLFDSRSINYLSTTTDVPAV